MLKLSDKTKKIIENIERQKGLYEEQVKNLEELRRTTILKEFLRITDEDFPVKSKTTSKHPSTISQAIVTYTLSNGNVITVQAKDLPKELIPKGLKNLKP